MWRLVACCAVLTLVRSQTTEVTQCTQSEGELPINVYIEGCQIPPCDLPQLQDVVVDIVFRAPRTMGTMQTHATAYIPSLFGLELPVNYPLQENSVTCNFLSNSYCPVMEGEIIQYTLKMFIESFFPVGTSANIEFRVVDENNAPVLCLRTAIRIVAAINASPLEDNWVA